MQIRQVLVEAFQLLREEPRLFLPRIVMTFLWSFFWIYAAQIFRTALAPDTVVSLETVTVTSILAMILVPVQLAVYNAYFIMARQHETVKHINMHDAFYRGLLKLPESIAVFSLLGTMALILGMPGAMIFLYGIALQNGYVMMAGLVLSGTAVSAVMLLSYFTPVSVVLGEKSFLENIKEGVQVSRTERHAILVLTLLSFATLLLTFLVDGGLRQAGIVGFFLGRFVAAVLGVYLIIINPELFLHVEKKKNG